jgi:hypothetical protein
MYFPATNFTDCSTLAGLNGGPDMQACGPADRFASVTTANDVLSLWQVGRARKCASSLLPHAPHRLF